MKRPAKSILDSAHSRAAMLREYGAAPELRTSQEVSAARNETLVPVHLGTLDIVTQYLESGPNDWPDPDKVTRAFATWLAYLFWRHSGMSKKRACVEAAKVSGLKAEHIRRRLYEFIRECDGCAK